MCKFHVPTDHKIAGYSKSILTAVEVSFKEAMNYTIKPTNLKLKTIFSAVTRSPFLQAVQPVFHSSVLGFIKSKILLTKPASVTLSRAWIILVVSIRCRHIYTWLRWEAIWRGCPHGGFWFWFIFTLAWRGFSAEQNKESFTELPIRARS